jgi:hypothetical protein
MSPLLSLGWVVFVMASVWLAGAIAVKVWRVRLVKRAGAPASTSLVTEDAAAYALRLRREAAGADS